MEGWFYILGNFSQFEIFTPYSDSGICCAKEN